MIYWNLHSIKSENWLVYHVIWTREQIELKKKYIILFAYQIQSRCVANIERKHREKYWLRMPVSRLKVISSVYPVTGLPRPTGFPEQKFYRAPIEL